MRTPRRSLSVLGGLLGHVGLLGLVGLLCLGGLLVAGCGTGSSPSSADDGKLAVVAAEDFWGSIARQLGGERVNVTSVITNPSGDPHDYEPTPRDGRIMARAGYVIVNGLGYDSWADKLVRANPVSGRKVLDVGDLVGLKAGDNPHRWYAPDDVQQVVDKVTADYRALRPAEAAYFDQQHERFESTALAGYKATVTDIKNRYGGTPIGASESIVTPLAEALGLVVLTPESFMDAVSEGSDPTAADKVAVDQQIITRSIRVFVYNSQNSTPDVQRLVDAARSKGIPVVTVTETLVPEGATFQSWQTTQLQALAAALSTATGR